MGVSILTNLGHPEWIADSPKEYIAIINRLASDWEKLNNTRLSLREEMLASPLCNAPLFAKNFEDTMLSLFPEVV